MFKHQKERQSMLLFFIHIVKTSVKNFKSHVDVIFIHRVLLFTAFCQSKIDLICTNVLGKSFLQNREGILYLSLVLSSYLRAFPQTTVPSEDTTKRKCFLTRIDHSHEFFIVCSRRWWKEMRGPLPALLTTRRPPLWPRAAF